MPEFHREMYRDLNFDEMIGVLWIAFRESAKRQPLDAKILTPSGWTTMGDLNVGDNVIGSDGKATRIKFMSDIVDRPVYEIETEDGRKTECDGEHLWTVRKMTNVKNKYETLTINDLLDRGLYYDRKPDYRNGKKYKEYKFAIDTCKPIEFKEKELPIEPYFLGLWLGDGTASSVDITSEDVEVENYLKGYADRLGLKFKKKKDKGNADTLSITRGYTGGINRFSLQGELRKLGVLNNKHIPEEYLLGSIEQRKALLEGLMDSDGTTSSGTLSFSNKNERIVDGLIDLVRSLGGRASKSKAKTFCYYNGERKECDYYRVSILFTDYTPFKIIKKKDKHKLSNHTFSRIVNIKLVGNKLGRCIGISNENGLYITDDYLLTHNSSLAKIKIIHSIVYDYKKYILWTSFDEKKAAANLFDVVLQLQTNKKLISDFGQLFYDDNINNEKKSHKKSIKEFITKNEVKVQAYSTGQSARGAVFGSYRPDLIILDDIENDKTIVSEPKTEQVIHYIDELFAGLSGDANILILGNRLTNSGSISYVENRFKGDERFIIRDIPVAINGETTWKSKYAMTDEEAKNRNKGIEDSKSKIISLETKKRILGETVYNREMMNKPLSDDMREIRWKWLQNYYTQLNVKDRLRNRYITIDVADTKERENRKVKGKIDYTGIIVVDWDIENYWYVKYAKRRRMNAPELIDEIFRLWEFYKPIKIGIEKKSFEDQVKPYIQQRSEETSIYPVVVELEHGGNRKEDRIRGALQGRLQAGKIKFLSDSNDNTEELRNELYDFPKAEYDDLSDALAYIDQIGNRPTVTGDSTIMPEIHKEFYENKKKIDNLISKVRNI